MTDPTDPLEARPMVGRPPKGTTVHLQHDHDLRTSLCGEEMPQDKPWELDYLCSFCWAALATPRPAGVLHDPRNVDGCPLCPCTEPGK